MKLLIDGYNLMFAWGIVGRESDPGMLARSRTALLEFLASTLPDPQQATIVFDAREAPAGLPRAQTYRSLTVLFSEPDEEADDVLERLIRAEATPRKLTVVSSDHRVQTAARRRRAAYVDCDPWLASLSTLAARAPASPGTDQPERTEQDKPEPTQSAEEIARWLREFDQEL